MFFRIGCQIQAKLMGRILWDAQVVYFRLLSYVKLLVNKLIKLLVAERVV